MTSQDQARNIEPDRILVIDDGPNILKLMVSFLQQAGYSLESTADSGEAVRLLEASDFDLIVSDIVMPHLNGLELLGLAKRRNPNIPVVLVTGHASEDFAQEALSNGASGFIEKPFRAEEFLAVVRQALWRRRLSSGVEPEAR